METVPATNELEVGLHRSFSASFRFHDDLSLGNTVQTTVARLNRSFFKRRRDPAVSKSFTASAPDRPIYILSRTSLFHRYWYSWMSFLLNYSSITSMYYLAYEWPGCFLTSLDRLVWAMFLTDLFLEFFTDFQDDDCTTITKHPAIILRYTRGWFLFDLLAVIPLSEFGYVQEECYLRLIRLLKVKRGLELLNGSFLGPAIRFVVRPKDPAEVQNLTIVVKYIISFMQIIGSMLFTTYILAAAFFWWSNFTLSWGNSHNDHFVTHFGLESLTGAQNLLRSCYFLATTLSTVGYGDYYAINLYEKLLLIIVLLIGISQFSLIVANFNGLLAEIDQNAHTGEGMSELSTWISLIESGGQKMSQHFKDRILAHFQYYWENDRLHGLALQWWTANTLEGLVTPQDQYLVAMPEGCKRGVLQFLFADLREKYRFVFVKNTDLILDLCYHFQPRFFKMGQVIVEMEDDVQEVIFVMKGEVGCGVSVAGAFKDLVFFQNRCIIGDYETIHRKPSLASYRALSPSGLQAFMLPSKVFHFILTNKYKAQFIRLSISTEAKATYISSTLSKYIHPTEPVTSPFFATFKSRLVQRRGGREPSVFEARPVVKAEKTVTKKDYAELELRWEREKADYEAKRNQAMLAIIKKVGSRLRA